MYTQIDVGDNNIIYSQLLCIYFIYLSIYVVQREVYNNITLAITIYNVPIISLVYICVLIIIKIGYSSNTSLYIYIYSIYIYIYREVLLLYIVCIPPYINIYNIYIYIRRYTYLYYTYLPILIGRYSNYIIMK